MAFGYTVKEQGSFGNVFFRVYALTDIQATGSSVLVEGAKRIIFASANNQTDTDEVMYCSWSGTTITVLCGTDNDDGYMFVVYK